MYGEGIDLAAITEHAADFTKKNDRQPFIPILRFIEEFATRKHMFLHGRILLREQCTSATCAIAPDLWMFELFSRDIEADMHQCARELHAHLLKESKTPNIYCDYRTICVLTAQANACYRLMINYRVIAVGYSLSMRDVGEIFNILKPISTIGPFGTPNSLFTPYVMQILQLTRTLCNPALTSTWAQSMEQLEWVMSRYAEGKSTHEGGDPQTQGSTAVDQTTTGILIGECAVAYYMRTWPPHKGMRVQYLSTFEDLEATAINLHIPNEARMRKMTVKNSDGAFVADIFNVCAYELVPVSGTLSKEEYRILPYGKGGKSIASPICVLRFLFVEIWALSHFIAKQRMRGQDIGPIARRCAFLVALAQRFYVWIGSCKIDILFPLKYEGVFVPETKKSTKANHFFPADEQKIKELLIEMRIIIN